MNRTRDGNTCWTQVEETRARLISDIQDYRYALQHLEPTNQWHQVREGNVQNLAQIDCRLRAMSRQDREAFQFMLDLDLTPILAAYALAIVDWIEQRRDSGL